MNVAFYFKGRGKVQLLKQNEMFKKNSPSVKNRENKGAKTNKKRRIMKCKM